ncbi:hypothetical protein ACFOY5_17855 [Massilia aurea]|uniref:hypothetical protein n=2 Tax=Massilia aurea TaxID=373040 RepID=UPI00338A427E
MGVSGLTNRDLSSKIPVINHVLTPLENAMNLVVKVRVLRHIRQSGYRPQLEDLSPDLFPFWQRTAGKEFPGMPDNALFFMHAATGLMRFFEVAADRREPCALPSLAADSVWHAWMAWDAVNLEHFCRRHFGKPIDHLPHAMLDALALPRVLVGCREHEDARSRVRGLPALFRLDATLRMPYGHGYALQDEDIVYTRLNANGRMAGGARPHPGLTLRALLLANLISQADYAAALREKRGPDTGAGTYYVGDGGSDNAMRDCDADLTCHGGGSDGGDGGGGGSCGGGGGGGD